MALSWQKGTLFAVGLAVGVAAGVAGVMAWRDGRLPNGSDPARTLGGPGATSATASATPAASASTAVVAAAKECGVAPVVARKGAEDGKLSLQAKPSAATAPEVSALILSGKEAAASGRDRDAEVAFLNACRNAALLASDPVPAADAMYQLARHYANLAAFGAQPARELYGRAERFYSASLLTYTARYGTDHEKTRFATEGLKTVQQATGGNGPVEVARAEPPKAAAAPAPAAPPPAPSAPTAAGPTATGPAPAVAAPPPQAPPVVSAPSVQAPAVGAAAPPVSQKPETTRSAPAVAVTPPAAPVPVPQEQRQVAAAAPVQPAPPQARRANASFDCARAHSATEKLICADEDLARQDRELGRLHQRARQAAADPRAFQRESDAQWQRREDTCRDRECLQRWYAQRRAELAAATAAAPRPSRAERTERTERTAAPQRAQRPAPAEPAARSTPPEPREPTTAAGAGAARPLPEIEEPVTRAPVVRAPPMRARVAEPDEQPPEPGVASGSAGAAPQAEGSADAP